MANQHPLVRFIEHQEIARDKERDPVGWWLRKLDFSKLAPFVRFSIERVNHFEQNESRIRMLIATYEARGDVRSVREDFRMSTYGARDNQGFVEIVIKREIREFLGEALWSLVDEHTDIHVHNRGYKTPHPEDTRPGPVDPYWGKSRDVELADA